MTNFERIKNMSVKELAEFMKELQDEQPWVDEFEKELCEECPVVATENWGAGISEFKECDFHDGKCPHGDRAVWWLRQEIKT